MLMNMYVIILVGNIVTVNKQHMYLCIVIFNGVQL